MKHRFPEGMGPTTSGKLLATVGLRMPYVFLATIAKGLDTSVGHLGFLLGLAELVGLATIFIGRSIDRGAYRRWLMTGLFSVAAGLVVMAFANSAPVFAVGFAGATLGVALYTTTSHSWIGHEVPYERRGQVIGVFETSWALALLLGAPIVGLLIAATNWQVPWGVIALLLVPIALWLYRTFPTSPPRLAAKDAHVRFRADRATVLTVASSFFAPFGAIAIFATYGAWLGERFGLSVRTVGILSIAIGGAELLASVATVRFSDRWGKTRSAIGGLVLMCIGGVAVATVPKVTALGIAALVVVFLGFEFGFICVLSIVSEVGGERRGAVVAVNGSLMTIGRASSAALATMIYSSHGMRAAASITAVCAAIAAICIANA